MTSLSAGNAIPDFVLKNTSGGPVRLSEYQKGGPALVIFFKHECTTCQLALPFLEQIYRRCRGGAFQCLGVAEDGKAEAVAFAKEYAIMMPLVLEEPPYATSEAFGLTNVPTAFLVDGERRIQFVQVGFSKKAYQELADRAAALAGKPPFALFGMAHNVAALKPG